MIREMNSKLVKNVAWNVSLDNLKGSQKISTKIGNSRDYTTLLDVAVAP